MSTTPLRLLSRVPLILLFAALAVSRTINSRGATLADFGYRNLADNDAFATLGHRPLLAILVEFETTPPLRLGYPTSYYDTLFFDFFAPNTVNGFYLENSITRFYWSRGGILLLSLSASETSAAMGDASRFYANIVAKAMMSGRFNFQAYDANSDNIVSQDELQIIIVRADAPVDGNNRPFGSVRPPGFTYTVEGSAAQVGHLTGLSTICHELGHTLQAPYGIELYGVWNVECLSDHLTLMSCTSFTANDMSRWHFDPWHKLAFGWCEPRIRSVRAGGVETLSAAQMRDSGASVILFDPFVGMNEFFMLEYRTRTSPNGPGYDAQAAGDGLVIWHIQQGGDHIPVGAPVGAPPSDQRVGVWSEGAPNLARGSSSVWGGDSSTPYLRWNNGCRTPVRIHVRPFTTGAGSITIDILSEPETWVDFGFSGSPEVGTFDKPYNTLAEGVANVAFAGYLKIKPGATAEMMTINKAMTIEACGGPVIIGRFP